MRLTISISQRDGIVFNGLIQQQNGNVIWRRQSARKGLNSTSGAQFAAQPLVKPVVWFARAVVNCVPVLLLNQPIVERATDPFTLTQK